MPTTYAHWAFGRECIEKMPKNLQEIIHEHRDLYNLGVHGPDIFFYNLLDSKGVRYGVEMHNTPAEEFFKKCKDIFKQHDEKAEMLAYLMGFLSHFVLDSEVHGYVERKKEVSNISHNCIEAQWDRHVMLKDNRVPNLIDRAEALKPNKKNAKIISYFHPFEPKAILSTCRWQRFVVSLVTAISPAKQNFLQKVVRKLGLNNYADLYIGFEEMEECRDSNIRLDKLSAKALENYPKLMKNLLNYLNGQEKLNKQFNNDFSIRPDYKDIEVLPIKKELNYKIK